MALHTMDKTLTWETPVLVRGGWTKESNIPDNFCRIKRVKKDDKKHKYNQAFIEFKQPFLKKHFEEGATEHRVAISFDGDRLIFAFNPPEGVPFYKLSIHGSGKDRDNKPRALVNVDIIDRIWAHFKLDDKKDNYWLKAYYFAEINDIQLYVMRPQDYQSMTPVFDDEKNGTWNVHDR